MRKICQLLGVALTLVMGVAIVQPAAAESRLPENRASWEEVETPKGFDTPSGIGVINDSDVWVFGKGADEVAQSAHWDGKSWTPVPIPDFSDLATFAAKAPDDIWIGGRGKEGKYFAHWDGHEWKTVEPGEKYSSMVNDIEFIGEDVWVAGGCCGHPGWLIRWDGQQWHEHEVPREAPAGTRKDAPPNELLYVEGLAATASGELVGSGMHSSSAGLSTVLVRGGKDGVEREKPPTEAAAAVLKRAGTVDGKTIYASGWTNNGAVILRRSGDRWTNEELPGGGGCSPGAMARAGKSLYVSSDASFGDPCAFRLNPDSAKWEKIPHHGLDTNAFMPSIVISGSADSDALWAFGNDSAGTHVKRYRP